LLPPGWDGPYTHEDLVADMDAVGVDEAVVVTTPLYGRGPRANEYTMRAIEAHPDRLYGVGLVEFFRDDPEAVREAVRRVVGHERMLGVRIHAALDYEDPAELVPTSDWILDDRLAPFWTEAAAQDTCVFVFPKAPQLSMVERLAREIRRRTKPMVVAANKMDTDAARDNWAEITSDPDYEHLTIVPVSAHAEKALKKGREAGLLEYRPGDADFEVNGDLPEGKREGLARIESFLAAFGGTGVQRALEAALFEELGAIAVFPGARNPQEDGTFLQDCFVLPGGSTAEEFAYFLHTDIGEGFLHAHDVRSGRQIGADAELSHRDVVEITTTN